MTTEIRQGDVLSESLFRRSDRRTDRTTDDWITPKSIIDALGPFDLDPCASATQPWKTANKMIQPPNDGMKTKWLGRVWLNPPYGNETFRWVNRLIEHGNGIAFIFARTDTSLFHELVFPVADAILFMKGRVTFAKPDGRPGQWNAGVPSCLIAYGEENVKPLES